MNYNSIRWRTSKGDKQIIFYILVGKYEEGKGFGGRGIEVEQANNRWFISSHAPHELYQYMRRCLALEMEVIQSAMGGQYECAAPHTERKYSEVSAGGVVGKLGSSWLEG